MRIKRKLIVCFLSFALILGMIPTASVSAAKKISLNNKKISIKTGKSKTIKVKNTKKKVIWKILSGKKYITLKKKGKTAATIKGKKKGKAKVQARIGKKKLTCAVTVKNAKKPKKTNTPTPSPSTKPTATPASPVTSPPTTMTEPTSKNVQDVVALKALIVEQRERGATVSEDINDENYYHWENGRLTKICWHSED